MAMRSAMRDILRRQAQGHGENGAAAGTGAERRDFSAHAPRELTCDSETQSRAMCHAIAAAAIVDVEEFFGAFRRETAALVTDLEMPVPRPHRGRQLDLAATVLVRVVEQVFENHA